MHSQLKLKAVGDITLVTKQPFSPFREIALTLRDKHVLIGNLETVLSTRGTKCEKAIILQSDPWKVRYLKEAGFDVSGAAEWRRFAFSPSDAAHWVKGEFSLGDAVAWRKHGFGPRDAGPWRDRGYSPITAADKKRAGKVP